jgi:hypothetical protein
MQAICIIVVNYNRVIWSCILSKFKLNGGIIQKHMFSYIKLKEFKSDF